jgi:hypothetical protein
MTVDHISLNDRIIDELKRILKEDPWPNRGTFPEFAKRNWGKPRRIPVRKTGVSAASRTEYLPNANLDRNRYDSSHGSVQPVHSVELSAS